MVEPFESEPRAPGSGSARFAAVVGAVESRRIVGAGRFGAGWNASGQWW